MTGTARILKYPPRFTLDDYDRYQIAQIQRDVGLDFQNAQLLYHYRKPHQGRLSWLSAQEQQFCKALEKRIARAKAEAAFPLRKNGNGSD
jgi:hypothetical protein